MRTGSVTSAADGLKLTQPAVSKLLKALEMEVGFPLFNRVNGRLTPSAQGAAFYQRVQRVLTDIEELSTIAQNVAANRFGEIRLVAMSQLLTYAGPKAGTSYWPVPARDYTPLQQQAVLLRRAKDNAAAAAFLRFLKTAQTRAAIRRYGYGP